MKQLLLVFLGGGIGSVLRFLISRILNPDTGIPYGTLLVNILGSLLIGFFIGIGIKQQLLSSYSMLLFVTGFCGGFTTFSTFAFENQMFLRSGDYLNFALYGFGSILLGVLAVFLGLFLAKWV